MYQEDNDSKIIRLEQEMATLKRKLDEFTNPSTISESFLKTLVDRGFVRHKFDLTTYTNPSGLEFYSFMADFNNTSGLIAYTPKERLISFTADISDTCTANNHGLSDGQDVYVVSTGTFPSPLSNQTIYYIRDATTNTFKLTTSPGGTAVNITTVGSGNNYILVV